MKCNEKNVRNLLQIYRLSTEELWTETGGEGWSIAFCFRRTFQMGSNLMIVV